MVTHSAATVRGLKILVAGRTRKARNLVEPRTRLTSFRDRNELAQMQSFFVFIAILDILLALPFCHVALKADKPKSANYPKTLKTIGAYQKKEIAVGTFSKASCTRYRGR